jgi:hypothetical protein
VSILPKVPNPSHREAAKSSITAIFAGHPDSSWTSTELSFTHCTNGTLLSMPFR